MIYSTSSHVGIGFPGHHLLLVHDSQGFHTSEYLIFKSLQVGMVLFQFSEFLGDSFVSRHMLHLRRASMCCRVTYAICTIEVEYYLIYQFDHWMKISFHMRFYSLFMNHLLETLLFEIICYHWVCVDLCLCFH